MKIYTVAIVLFCVSYIPISYCRNVTIQLNPGWSDKIGEKSGDVVYAKSQGENDCLHYIWSTVNSSFPTLMLIRSNSTGNLNINWTKLLSPLSSKTIEGSVYVDGSAYDSAVHIFNKLIQYNDTKNNVDVKSGTNTSIFYLNRFKWNVNVTDGHILIEGKSLEYPKSFTEYSSIDIKLMPYNIDSRQKDLPRLAYNDMSLGLEIAINNVSTTLRGPRFLVNFFAFNPGNSSYNNTLICDKTHLDLLTKATIDDEYCPAVFSTQQILWENTPKPTNYWQWRSVCYTSKDRSTNSATDVSASKLEIMHSTSDVLENRILLAYYGLKVLKNMEIMGTNISFGKPDDGFYDATNYLSWTSVTGFGVAPSDSYSLTVIVIIFTGIGFPVIIILLGITFMIYRKLKKEKVDHSSKYGYNYEPIS